MKVEEQKVMITNANKDEVAASSETFNLGLLSLNLGGFETPSLTHQQSQVASQVDTRSKSQNYLPLIVDHHKGASYNQTFQVSRVVMDNDKVFASNYPLPEFFFKHQDGYSMLVDKFTVRSTQSMKCGANPIGSGLIFTGDTLSDFDKTLPFHRFSI